MHAPALARTDDLAGTAAIEKAFERPRKAENKTAMRIIPVLPKDVASETTTGSVWQVWACQVKSSNTGSEMTCPPRW